MPASPDATKNAPAAQHAQAFAFVSTLAGELSSGKIDLPSFPDVAIRVRRALGDDKTTVDQVVRIVGSEPALAARLLKMSNSAALNRSGRQVTELRTAIARMGYNMVRSAAISFAMAQIRASAGLKGLEKPLDELWRTSTYVAAFCYVLAKNHTSRNADEAFLAGLLHGVGRLYILTRTPRFPALLGDAAALDEIMRNWHANVAKAILENWELNEQLVLAVAEQDDIGREHEGPADIADILVCANMMAAYIDLPEDLVLNMSGVRSFRMLGLDERNSAKILAESRDEIEALRQALGN
ncbi:MAG TPA: HDOD domain-containing protein [Steroidobacteraceae bacterium]|nr:HDOD domain-containing protein [Steroidobacteraceae bacterium]